MFVRDLTGRPVREGWEYWTVRGVYRMNVCESSDWKACKGRLQVLDSEGGILDECV